MLEAKIYNQKGETEGMISLPEKVFGAKWRADLVHQVVEGMRSNKRAGTADTKGRGEVRGGGKKPWRQKGTGRARHGSIRSPIWVGGGVTHGPLSEKNYKRKISKKMRSQALFSTLSKKLKDGEIIFVNSLSQNKIKTKEGAKVIADLTKGAGLKVSKTKNPKILINFFDKEEKTLKTFRNLNGVEIAFIKDLNPLTSLSYKYLLIENPEKSVEFLSKKV
jgi:large subunit ribosomal protein L4